MLFRQPSSTGFVRWKSVIAINRLFENLENIPATLIKPIGTFPPSQTGSYLQEENGDDEENFDESNLTPTKRGPVHALSHAYSLNSSASTDVSYDSVDEEDANQLRNKFVLENIDEMNENNGVSTGNGKKDKSSSTYFFHKYKRWVSKGFVSFLHNAADKSRSFSSMQYS